MSQANQLTSIPARMVSNMCFGTVLAVVGGTTSAFTTTGTPAVSVDGKTFALTAQTSTALSALAASDLPTALANWVQPSGTAGFYVQPASTTVYYLIGVNGSGTWKVIQGTYDNQPLPLNGNGAVGKSVIPDAPDGFTTVSVMKIVSGGSAFTPATTALTSISTFLNVSVLPSYRTF
jgi:hypothetical protein